jgi:mono/diheme cytochrome c family protein
VTYGTLSSRLILIIKVLADFAMNAYSMTWNWIGRASLFVAALAGTAAFGADADNGLQIARRWCASCHIIEPNQRTGSEAVPPFATIARMPDLDASKMALFLLNPQTKMPDMSLTRDEAADLAAYIVTLK